MKELYINGRLVDLDKKGLIALTFSVNNLAELKDRQANFSNIFKCPATENNREIFGYADYDAFTQNEPYNYLSAKIVQNGIEIVPNGIAIIQSAGEYFEIQVLSGVKGFLATIEDKALQELNLSSFDHTWNLSTVSYSQINTSGFIYPIINYGALPGDSRTVDVRQLRPAVYNHSLIDKIITEAGYTYSGNVFQDPVFLKELIPFTNDKFEHSPEWIKNQSGYSAEARKDTLQVLGANNREYVINFPTIISDPSNRFNGTEYIVQNVVKIKINLKYGIAVKDTFSGGSRPSTWVKFQKYVNGSWMIIAENQHLVGPDFNEFFYYNNQELEVELNLNPGEKIRVLARHEPDTGRIRSDFLAGSTIKFTYLTTDVVYGQQVQMNMVVPKISQKDHLKDFMQRYCLTPVVDNYKKKITFYSFKNLYANKSIAKDWTEKFTNKKEEAEFSFGNYAQLNYGRYKDDENVTDEFGDGSFAVDNKTIKPETDLFSSVFSATESGAVLNNIQVLSIKKIENSAESTEFKIKTQPRIVVNKTYTGLGITFIDGITSGEPFILTSIPSFSELNYNTLFSKYYYELINYMLKKARKVTREVILEEIDIANLDHFIPIYDANEAKYYYLNQISDYIEGEPTKCEFIRM